jgi:hypothetical protein
MMARWQRSRGRLPGRDPFHLQGRNVLARSGRTQKLISTPDLKQKAGIGHSPRKLQSLAISKASMLHGPPTGLMELRSDSSKLC